LKDALARIRDRVRQNRAAQREAIEATRRTLAGPADRLGSRFAPGMKVFDRITGLEGEVIDGTRENIVVPIAE
jgi:hypothetical protein